MRPALLLCAIVAVSSAVVEKPLPPDQDGRPPVTGLSARALDHLSYLRTIGGFANGRMVPPEAAAEAKAWQALIDAGDPVATARRLVEVWDTPAAPDEIAGLCCALRGETGMPVGKFLTANQDEFPVMRDAAPAVAILDAVAASSHPRRDEIQAELILHLACQGLSTLAIPSGNGAGNVRLFVPDALVERAAGFLTHADPFVRGMAEWTLAMRVANDAEGYQKTRGSTKPRPITDDGPAWQRAYLEIPASAYVELDQVRQALTLAVHRSPALLRDLARDVARRAEAKADWLRQQGRAPAGQAAARSAVRAAVAQLDAAVDLAAARRAYLAVRACARDLALADPDLAHGFVFVQRPAPDGFLQPGISSARHYGAGGGISVAEGVDPASPARSVLGDGLPHGGVQAMDLWYDADRVVFSWSDGTISNLHEIGLDGRGLRQLATSEYSDVDPAYLPDGSVVFGSMRSETGVTCAGALGSTGRGGGGHTNIFRVWPDGSTVRQLTHSKDDDAYPHVLDDGRVIWMRWDYQERGVDEVFSLWAIRPDGTASDGYFKTHIPHRTTVMALRNARQISGTPYLVAAGSSHHMGAYGALVVVDPQSGINNPDGIRNVTPNASPLQHGWRGLRPVAEGGVPYIGGHYQHPYGLSDKTFLVAATYEQPNSCNAAAYYVDVWGNQELLRRHPYLDTSFPMPLTKRLRPPVLPDTTRPDVDHATLYLDNVYADLPGVEKGQVQGIRILQMLHWYKTIGEQGLQWNPVANAGWAFGYGTCAPVRVVGTVPVEADGSAHFQVPAGCDLYFQAVDANGMALQRMRTHVEFQHGESRSCIGCHETRSNAIAAQSYGRGLALAKPAVRPVPPPWGDRRVMDYETMIQPILQAKCVECHGGEQPKAGLELTDAKDAYGFMQSYRSMYGLKRGDPTPGVVWGAEGPVGGKKDKSTAKPPSHPWWEAMRKGVVPRGPTMGEVTQVKQFGAWQCPLIVKVATDPEHRKLLTDDEMRTLACWADVAAPYFDSYMRQAGPKLERVRVIPPPAFQPALPRTVEPVVRR